MAKLINVEILGRNLGTAMSSEKKTYRIPIRADGGGEAVDPTGAAIDLVDLLHAIPRR